MSIHWLMVMSPFADAPDVWSDGSLVLDVFFGVGVVGCGVYAH